MLESAGGIWQATDELALARTKARNKTRTNAELGKAAETIRSTRPTAVNLFWAIDRIIGKAENSSGNIKDMAGLIIREEEVK
jgi:methylthioribose-1-phosphate isomerase